MNRIEIGSAAEMFGEWRSLDVLILVQIQSGINTVLSDYPKLGWWLNGANILVITYNRVVLFPSFSPLFY